MRSNISRAMMPLLALLALPAIAQTPPSAQDRATPPTPAAVAPPRSTLKPPVEPNADTSQPRQRLVTVFGTEECPKPTSPDEVVVCARLPDSELYRIPPQLRAANNQRVSPFQANRSLLLGDSSGGAGGSIGSCSVNGAGGMIGCSRQQVDAWAQDRANRMGTEEEVPR